MLRALALISQLLTPSRDAYQDAKARYLTLTDAQAQTCDELVRLAVASCAGLEDCDPSDYIPVSCGGNVAR